MLDKIKNNLDRYLGFDSNELFVDDMIRVFGGAIRDSIADMPIKDIDILCGPHSCKAISKILETNGYRHLPSVLSSYEIGQVYQIKGVINEPLTYIKDGGMVQLIRPTFNLIDGPLNRSLPKDMIDEIKQRSLKEAFTNLIANVDISCCGVSWDGKVLYENYPNAILHCKSKLFTINTKASMYIENRIIHRTGKLTERGWDELTNTVQNVRELKIAQLLNTIDFSYFKEYDKTHKSFVYPTESLLDGYDLPF